MIFVLITKLILPEPQLPDTTQAQFTIYETDPKYFIWNLDKFLSHKKEIVLWGSSEGISAFPTLAVKKATEHSVVNMSIGGATPSTLIEQLGLLRSVHPKENFQGDVFVLALHPLMLQKQIGESVLETEIKRYGIFDPPWEFPGATYRPVLRICALPVLYLEWMTHWPDFYINRKRRPIPIQKIAPDVKTISKIEKTKLSYSMNKEELKALKAAIQSISRLKAKAVLVNMPFAKWFKQIYFKEFQEFQKTLDNYSKLYPSVTVLDLSEYDAPELFVDYTSHCQDLAAMEFSSILSKMIQDKYLKDSSIPLKDQRR
jgi:hypothetical protein